MSSLLRIVFEADTTAPSVPTNLVATTINSTQINLSWTASTDSAGGPLAPPTGLQHYRIYRNGSFLTTSATNLFNNTGLTNGQTYTYRVSAVDVAGNESAQSAQVQATAADITAPSVPTNLAATAVSTTQINLSWTASTDTGGAGLLGYRVYRNGASTPIGSPTSNSFSDTGLTAGTTYTYRVSARDNATNESAQSSQAQATTQSGNQAPVWTTPAPTFFIGVASNYTLPVSDPESDALELALASGSAALPTGVTLNSAQKRLEYNGAGSVGTTSGIIIRATEVTTADSDWNARRAAVIAAGGVAYGMDTSTEVTSNYFVGGNGTRGFFDTTTKVGSGGSLRFELRAGDSSANIAGSWTKTSSPWVFGRGYGQNSTFYISYRARLSATMISNLNQWNSVWKQIIIHANNLTCASLELTHTHPDNGSTMYTDCGGRHMYTAVTTPDHTENTPLLWQQDWNIDAGGPPWTREPGGIQSQYPNVNWEPPTNEWYEVYFKIHIGTFTSSGGGPKDSTIEMWITRQGASTRTKVISVRMGLAFQNSTSDVYNNLTLTPYMTGLSNSANQDATMHIDQLLISPSPIAIPATSIV